MKYQLMLQWPGVSGAEYDRLILLEETIRDGMEDTRIVDGHDFESAAVADFELAAADIDTQTKIFASVAQELTS
jgi:hypothetical protein